MFRPLFVPSLFILILSAPAFAVEFTLPPIVKDASPVDTLALDPVVPAKHDKIDISSGSGSVQQSLEEQMPYAVTDPGRPGSLSQFRGLGDRAEDTNVQGLGLPLNPPQGGGFDFSTFPQFFWSDYRFTPAPSLASLDPSGASGTLALNPWTAQALYQDDLRPRWTALYAGLDLQQFSVAEKYRDRVALLAGTSSGLANGPTASASARMYRDDRVDLRFHLLATRIDSTLYAPETVSPHQITDRVIPVVQADWNVSPDVVVKSSLFYDNLYIRYDDPSGSYFSRSRAQQYGIEDAVLVRDWKLGLSGKSVWYRGSDFAAPTENVANAFVGRTFTWSGLGGGKLLLDPSIQGVYETNYGSQPQGSVGLRRESNDGALAAFVRETYFRRLPSLLDRYSSSPSYGIQFPGILPNPSLQPEDDFTTVAGVEGKSGIWSGSLQGYYQLRDAADVLVTVPGGLNSQKQNVGQARIVTLTAEGSVQASSSFQFRDSVNYAHSRVDQLQSSFPYIPTLVNVLGTDFTPWDPFTASAIVRTQTPAFVSSSLGSLPTATFADLIASYRFPSGYQIVGRAENIGGTDLILESGYPPKGRVFALSLVGPLSGF